MRIVFYLPYGYLPELIGGSERSTEALVSHAVQAGHEVAVYCGATHLLPARLASRLLGTLTLARRYHVRTYRNGTPVYRTARPVEGLPGFLDAWRPDRFVISYGRPEPLLPALTQRSVPTLWYVRDLITVERTEDRAVCDQVVLVANSQFIGRQIRDRLGVDPVVIPPMIDHTRYDVSRAPSFVLFINPIPDKGLEIALHLARLRPDVPFVFLESWGGRLVAHAVTGLPPNVTLEPPTDDIRPYLAGAKLLLMPTGAGLDPNRRARMREGWGRVASEAQVSGIPVIASRDGGLAEAVGPGGILVDPDAPTEAWLEALNRILDDEVLATNLSIAAKRHASRPEFQADNLARRFLDVLKNSG